MKVPQADPEDSIDELLDFLDSDVAQSFDDDYAELVMAEVSPDLETRLLTAYIRRI